MKKIMSLSLVLFTAHTLQPAVAPKMIVPVAPKIAPAPIAKTPTPTTVAPKAATTVPNKTYSVDIAIAYDISIINTSATTATLSAITIQYTTSTSPNSVLTITAPTQTTIPAHKGISFNPKITISTTEQNISAQFQGITGITINSQFLKFPQAEMATSPIYITNTNGAWKITTKPTQKSLPKKTISQEAKTTTPAAATTKSMQATAVPFVKTAHPDMPIMPKNQPLNTPKMLAPKTPATTIPPMPVAPKTPIMPKAKTSLAAKASAQAINQTIAK